MARSRNSSSATSSFAPLLRRVAPTLRRRRGALALAYIAMVALALSGAALALLSGPAVAMVLGSPAPLVSASSRLVALGRWLQERLPLDPAHAGYTLVPLFLVLNAAIKGAAQTCQFTLLGHISLACQQELREQAFTRLLRARPAFFQRMRQGDLLSRLTQDLATIEQAVFYGLGSLLRDSLAVALLVITLIAHDPKLSVVLTITVPLAVWPLRRFGRWLKSASRTSQRVQGELTSICHETMLGLVDIQLNQQEPRQLDALRRASDEYLQAMHRSYLVRAARTPAMELIGAAVLASGLLWLAHPGVSRPLEAAHYVTFLAGLVMIYDPIKKLGQVGDYIHAGAAASERVGEILDAQELEPEVSSATAPLSARGRTPASPVAVVGEVHELRFERVGLTYGPHVALEDVSFTVGRNERIALVGPSGAGKTSLLQLVSRLVEPSRGKIYFNNTPIDAYPRAFIRAQMTVVAQEASLFAGTIAENIAFGRPEASRHDITEAAREAGALEFISALALGFDTSLGERGLSLSGGQRQRLAIARAFLRARPLLVLDEATSQLDQDSERHVQRALDKLSRRCTTLMVAHRLATVRDATRIVVLDRGAIVSVGTHDELMAQPGFYARWVRHLATDGQPAPRAPSARTAQSPAPP